MFVLHTLDSCSCLSGVLCQDGIIGGTFHLCEFLYGGKPLNVHISICKDNTRMAIAT